MAKKVYVIETPNPHFDGIREGLKFKAGRAETEDAKVAKALITGYPYFCAELKKPKPNPDGNDDQNVTPPSPGDEGKPAEQDEPGE